MSKQAEIPLDQQKAEPKADQTPLPEAAKIDPETGEVKSPVHNEDDVRRALAAVAEPSDESGAPSRALSAYGSESAFKAAYRMAKSISYGTMVPAAYQGERNIPNVMIAMELANRIGASIMMVMQSLHVIQGRPSWAAQFLIATVNASRKFTPIRFRFVGDETKDSWGCRAWAKDRETGEECVGALITVAMAKAEGWATKSGSKWKTMPEQMLMYRAAAFWTRIYAPELSLGMHTTEEVIDTYGETVADTAPLPSQLTPGSTKALEASLRGDAAPS